MRIAIRVDGGGTIGTGHVMRCVTLASSLLKELDVEIYFLMRHLTTDLENFIRSHNLKVLRLKERPKESPTNNQNSYIDWLGVSIQDDISDTKEALQSLGSVDAIIVDHYGLDCSWQSPLREMVRYMIVIDDLANRKHYADILIDTNYYDKFEHRYDNLLPEQCLKVLGPSYTILREEFRTNRKNIDREVLKPRSLLVTLGGVDQPNHTSNVLRALKHIPPFDLVRVVIGVTHPYRNVVEELCSNEYYQLYVQTPHMGELMRKSDICIGAGGTSTWERMCVGLAGLTLCVAENQQEMLSDAHSNGILYAPDTDIFDTEALANHIIFLKSNPELLLRISRSGQQLVDGYGASRLASIIRESLGK